MRVPLLGEVEFPVVTISCWSVCVRLRKELLERMVELVEDEVVGQVDSNREGLEQGDEDGEGVVVKQR